MIQGAPCGSKPAVAGPTGIPLGTGLCLPPRYRPEPVTRCSRSRICEIRATPIDASSEEKTYEVCAQVGESLSHIPLAATSTRKGVEISVASTTSSPPTIRNGILGVGAVGIFVMFCAGVRSLWIHRNDKDLKMKIESQRLKYKEKLKKAESEHLEQLRKSEYKFSSKLEAKETEARAREQEIRDEIEKQFDENLTKQIFSKEKQIEEALKGKHADEIKALEASWQAQLDEKREEVDHQKMMLKKAKEDLGRMEASQQKVLEQEREFEEKTEVYNEAMKAVGPGGIVETLKEQIAQLEKEAKTRDLEMTKLREAAVSAPPAPPSAAAAPTTKKDKDGGASTTRASQSGAIEAPLGKLSLIAAGTVIPHMDRKDTGGEDAFFVSKKNCGAIGVADGVGAWSSDGVDPAQYPQEFLSAAQQKVDKSNGGVVKTMDMLRYAHDRVKVPGSATTIVAALQPDGDLEMANVGDCGARVIRNGACVFATQPRIHEFNMPYQLGCEKHLEATDHPSDAEVYHFKVQEGDVVVMGSDGLFDNIWDEDLASLVTKELNGSPAAETAQDLSERIADLAHRNAKSAFVRTPWAVREAQNGGNIFDMLFPKGGKMDDCTVVVGVVGK